MNKRKRIVAFTLGLTFLVTAFCCVSSNGYTKGTPVQTTKNYNCSVEDVQARKLINKQTDFDVFKSKCILHKIEIKGTDKYVVSIEPPVGWTPNTASREELDYIGIAVEDASTYTDYKYVKPSFTASNSPVKHAKYRTEDLVPVPGTNLLAL